MGRKYDYLIDSETKKEIIKSLRDNPENTHKLAKRHNKSYSNIYDHVMWLLENELILSKNNILYNNEENIKNYVLNRPKYFEKLSYHKKNFELLEDLYLE